MSRPQKSLILGLALLALLGAQVFGLQRGFVCICSGEAVETLAPDCKDENAHCCEQEHDGLPHEHAPRTVKHEASNKTPSSPEVQARALVAILEFVNFQTALHTSPAGAVMRPAQDRRGIPPASLQVAACTVLRI
jgi:hypothetical protein